MKVAAGSGKLSIENQRELQSLPSNKDWCVLSLWVASKELSLQLE